MRIAEIDEQDTHQIIVIGVAAIVPNNAFADSLMDEISAFVEQNTEAEILEEERCGKDRVRFEANDGWHHCALNHIVTADWFMKANMDRVFGFLDEVL